MTDLGFFAWLLATIHLNDETPPQVDRLLRDAGYLKADSGYIAPEDLPVPVSEN